MRFATPTALVLLAAGGSVYAYVVDRTRVSDADRAERPRDVFPSFRIDDVRRVKLSYGTDTMVLERTREAPSAWSIVSTERPTPEPADPAAVDVLLRELELARRVREVSVSPGAGLDPPRVRGDVSIGPLEYAFALGGDAPTPEGSAYMSLRGEGAFVIGPTLKVQLLRTADAYRDRTLVRYGASDVARIDVTSPTGALSIERAGATFRLGGASGVRASRVEIDRLFGALAEARAESFLDDAEADRLTASPLLTVIVTPRAAERPRVRFVVGQGCPHQKGTVVIARFEPTRMSTCIATETVAGLSLAPDAIADESLFFAHADEIEEMRLESLTGAGAPVEIARRGTGWRERSPEARDLAPEEVDSANSLVNALANARGLDAPVVPAGKTLAARWRATILRTGTSASEVVELGPPGPGGVTLAHRLDDNAMLRLTRETARHFEPRAIALRGRPVWPTAFDASRVVAIDDSCDQLHERIDLVSGRWIMRAPAGFAADALAVIDFADAYAHASADAWIAEADDGTFGFEPSAGSRGACIVKLTLNSPTPGGPVEEVGLTFGAKGDGGDYARVLDRPEIFVAPSILHDLASRPAIDRSRFRLDPATLARVTLRGEAANLTLKNVGGQLVATAGTASDVDAAAYDIERALAALQASDALHVGPALPSEGFDRPTLDIDAVSGAPEAPVPERRITIGALGDDGPAEVYFARVSGVDATFAVPRDQVQALLPFVLATGAPARIAQPR